MTRGYWLTPCDCGCGVTPIRELVELWVFSLFVGGGALLAGGAASWLSRLVWEGKP